MIDIDTLTGNLKKATDILFVKHPLATSMGFVFGVILHGVFVIFLPTLQSFTSLKISALNGFHFIALGIFGFNLRNLLDQRKFSPETERAIDFIEEQRKNGVLTKTEARQHYRKLIEQAVNEARVQGEG